MTVESDRNTVSVREREREIRSRLFASPSIFSPPFLPLFPSFPLSGFSSVCHSLRAQHLSWTLFLRTDWRLYQNLCPKCPSFFQRRKQSDLNSLSSFCVFQHKVPRPLPGPAIHLNPTLKVLKYCAAVFKSTHCHSFQPNHASLLCKLGFLIECALFTKLFAY